MHFAREGSLGENASRASERQLPIDNCQAIVGMGMTANGQRWERRETKPKESELPIWICPLRGEGCRICSILSICPSISLSLSLPSSRLMYASASEEKVNGQNHCFQLQLQLPAERSNSSSRADQEGKGALIGLSE